jgi:iron(III) transport system ATP-binding protein
VLIGPSGCGKTSLLRAVAGLEPLAGGSISLGEERLGDAASGLHLAPEQRRIGMVFQDYALFPHLSVAENVGYGLAGERLSRSDVAARVREALTLVDLDGLQDRPVTALSGGQQQRVALARALAPRPAVLLLDEPLSNLDPSLRERTRHELRQLVDRIGITTILVTHEQEEAFELADRVALLMAGGLVQVGTPEDLYARPASAAVTRFVGRATEVPANVAGLAADGVLVRALGTEFVATGSATLDGKAVLMIRPEALRVSEQGAVHATVIRRRFAGALDLLLVRVEGHEIEVAAPPQAAVVGDAVRLAPTGVGAHAFGVSGT